MKKEFIKDSIFSLVSHVLIYMKSLIIIPIIIKTVGVATYGSFALITSFVGILFGLSSLGVGVKSNRYLPSAKNKEERANLFYPQFYFKLFSIVIISILIIFFQGYIKEYFTNNNLIFSIYVIPLFLLLYTFYVYTYNYLRYTSRIFYMNIIGIAYAYGHIGFIILYATFLGKININILFLSQGIVALLVSMPFLVLIYNELGFKFIFFELNELKEQIKIGFPLILNLIVDFVLAASDRFVLAYFMGVVAVGLYVPPYMIGSAILLVPKAIGTVVPQLMSKSVDQNNFIQAKNLFFNAIKIYIVISIPFVFAIYMTGYEVLTIFSNEDVAREGRNIATIIAISSVFYGLNIMISQANMVDLKTSIIFKANLIAASINLLLNIILLCFIQSIYIPAITTLISFMVSTFYFSISLEKKWYDNRIVGIFIKVILVSFCTFFLVNYIEKYIGNLSLRNLFIFRLVLYLSIYTLFIFMVKIYTLVQLKEIKKVFVK